MLKIFTESCKDYPADRYSTPRKAVEGEAVTSKKYREDNSTSNFFPERGEAQKLADKLNEREEKE